MRLRNPLNYFSIMYLCVVQVNSYRKKNIRSQNIRTKYYVKIFCETKFYEISDSERCRYRLTEVRAWLLQFITNKASTVLQAFTYIHLMCRNKSG